MARLTPNKKSPIFKNEKIVRSARDFKGGSCERVWKHMHIRDKNKKRIRKKSPG